MRLTLLRIRLPTLASDHPNNFQIFPNLEYGMSVRNKRIRYAILGTKIYIKAIHNPADKNLYKVRKIT